MEFSVSLQLAKAPLLVFRWQTELVDEDRLVSEHVKLMFMKQRRRLDNFNLLNKRAHDTELLFNADPVNRGPNEDCRLGGMSMDGQKDSGKGNWSGGSGVRLC